MIFMTIHPTIKASRFLNCDGSIKIICDPASFFLSIEDAITRHVNQLGDSDKQAVIRDEAVFLVTFGQQVKVTLAAEPRPASSPPPVLAVPESHSDASASPPQA